MTHVNSCNAPRYDIDMHVVPSQHRGRHLKIHLYHSRRQYEYKVFVVAKINNYFALE